jgi:glycosyltransferase involved in cell wall biosynthesis
VQAAHRPRRVVIVQRALRRYRAGFYDRLRADLGRDGIELQVLHSTLPAHLDARDDALDLPWARHVPRRVVRVGGRHLVWQPLVRELRTADLIVVEQASQLLLNYRLLLRQAVGGPRVAFWGHGRSFAAGRSDVGERIKGLVSRRAHWWFAYTELSAAVVAELGVPAGRITVVDNAIDTTALRRDLEAVSPAALDALRRELGLGDGPVGLFLGALREDKHLDTLFEAAGQIREAVPGFHLLVIGSGPFEPAVRAEAQQHPWVSYLGARYGSDRAASLSLADVLLLPGTVGLVILDSFVAGAPLITSQGGTHSPEIAYLRNGENGVIVPGDVQAGRFADAVVEVLDDPELLERLRVGCAEDASRYGIEAMTARFADGIRQALDAAPERRRTARRPLTGSRGRARTSRGW